MNVDVLLLFNNNYKMKSIFSQISYNYCIFSEITNYNIIFTSFTVRPDKPIIKILETGESVEGYLGPYQIGTSLSLVCQVNGGK